jgi:uncharacterized protein YegP (UPF0339 family)
MSTLHKIDDYNFAQPSRSGRLGFESFKNENDGRFYFHFNDSQGVALLFSQAYRREIDRDKGVQSVIKNVSVETHFERHTTEGGCFFLLRAANRQEIARSCVFATLITLEEKRLFLRQNAAFSTEIAAASPAAIKAVPPAQATEQPLTVATSEKRSTVILTASNAAENDALKNKISLLEAQLATLQSTIAEAKGDTKDLTDDPLRQVFRIEVYKGNNLDRLHGKIIHPFSDEVQTFSGFDGQAILGFMSTKLQIDLPSPAATREISQTAAPQYSAVKTSVEYAVARPTLAALPQTSPVKVINLINNSANPSANQPFALELSALPRERQGIQMGQSCVVEVDVFNIDTREKYRMLEKRLNVVVDSDRQNVGVRVEPLVLNTGNYRLNLSVRVLSSHQAAADVQKWLGSSILQVG